MCFGDAELLSPTHNLLQLLELLALLVDEQLRVTDDVEEEHMPNLVTRPGVALVSHALVLRRHQEATKRNRVRAGVDEMGIEDFAARWPRQSVR